MDFLKIMSLFKRLIGVIALLSVVFPAYAVLQKVDDQTLSQESGQAAFYTAYNAPSGSGTGATSSDYGFFTLGLNGEVDINANIDHLQLGCGGVNGAGCDIDINQLSLSGNPGVGTCPSGASRASCDAVITNPFIELAIKNPTSLSTRQIVGIDLGAQNVVGLLTAGISNSTSLNGATSAPTGVGINTLSGYMQLASATGTAYTTATNISYSGSTACSAASNPSTCSTGTPITGSISDSGACIPCLNFSSTSYNLSLPSTAVTLTSNPATVNGTRLKSVSLTATGTVAPIYLTGTMSATITAIGLSLSETINPNTSSVNGLSVAATINEALSYIHSIPVNNPVSLSLQSTPITWPGSPSGDVAQPGWWMGFGGTVNIGNISPSSTVAINSVLNTVLADTSAAITQGTGTPINCGFLYLGCVGGTLPTTTITLASGTSVPFALNNLVLSAQTPVSNCYGGLKFCFLIPGFWMRRKSLYRKLSKSETA